MCCLSLLHMLILVALQLLLPLTLMLHLLLRVLLYFCCHCCYISDAACAVGGCCICCSLPLLQYLGVAIAICSCYRVCFDISAVIATAAYLVLQWLFLAAAFFAAGLLLLLMSFCSCCWLLLHVLGQPLYVLRLLPLGGSISNRNEKSKLGTRLSVAFPQIHGCSHDIPMSNYTHACRLIAIISSKCKCLALE